MNTSLSKNQISLINSLAIKKYREKAQLFLAEGYKLVTELIPHFECELLVYTENQTKEAETMPCQEKVLVDERTFQKISTQKAPQGILVVLRQKQPATVDNSVFSSELCLMLDEIQDPGNLGTIVRTADWFGIRHIFCSLTTADIYGIKAVQATMGALARVQLHYVDLEAFLQNTKHTPIYGTFLEGENIYETDLSPNGLIIMGNEGKGISQKLEKYITQKLYIPNYPSQTISSESLNVAVATAVVCAEFRRRRRLMCQCADVPICRCE